MKMGDFKSKTKKINPCEVCTKTTFCDAHMGVHTHAEEILYLKSLGTFRIEGSQSVERRKRLLKNYIKAAKNRVNWGLIKEREIVLYAKELLQGV